MCYRDRSWGSRVSDDEATVSIVSPFHQIEDEWGRKIVQAHVTLPTTAEESLIYLARVMPEIDWRGLAMYRFRAPDGHDVLALPAPIMEQLLSQVVGLCMVLSHDGPAH